VVAIHRVAAVPFEDGLGLARKQETYGSVVLEKCLEIVGLEIAGYMQGRKTVVVSRMACSKSELGEVVHHNQVHEVVLVMALESCSFAVVAAAAETAAAAAAAAVVVVVVVAGAQEWVDFAGDRQMNRTWTWRWEMVEDSSRTEVEEVLHQLL